ncbi:SurA N-terminal domain-containing protein [Paenibacillus sp. DMB20]|uniref:SurA N-terminal domain-containing protein n=1 Tax=Paenibacillus sp. DMB20 TaxID=1642570 RepID=UPI000B1E8189|nr:SurA N-terminal domain-containing protein [Paenibacillus sp. DMB20]
MKENDVQPTNNGRPEDELGQVPGQNPDTTSDPAASGEHNRQPDIPEEGNVDDNREINSNRDELTPVDDMASSDPSEPAADIPPGHNGSNPASAGGGGGKGWMVASLLLAAALVVVLIAPPFAKDTGKEAVATVNNVDITKDKLYDELVKAGGEQTLDGLIREELINQELGKKSIKITDAQVTEEIDSVKKNVPFRRRFQQCARIQRHDHGQLEGTDENAAGDHEAARRQG